MRTNWISVSMKVLLFCCVVFLGWAEYPLAVKSINSYIDYRIEEHLSSSINIPSSPPPMQELDGYQLDRQSAP